MRDGETMPLSGAGDDEAGQVLAKGAQASPERAEAQTSLVRPEPLGLRLVRIEGFEPAVPLSERERGSYLRRFGTLFVDEARARKGGLGSVAPATNAVGERFALKTLLEPEPAADSSNNVQLDAVRSAFCEEYACHVALSGFRGFPRLYGRGTVDGSPAIVMEWVEGMTLARARRALAIDDDGRMAPLTVARIGRELFELLCRMSLVGEGYVHRDISPANIMVRTQSVDAATQAEEGRFELCLIDFGSTSPGWTEKGDTSFTGAYSVVRRATADYAPPEMLSDDLEDLDELRRSAAVDVYEAASVIYELLCGHVPFDLHDEAASPYRTKVNSAPAPVHTAHAEGCDLERVLAGEPDAAVAAVKTTLDYAMDPEGERVREALELIDGQLSEIVLACLEPEQRRRPTPEAVRDALSAFCANYGENVGRALRGEPLLPCTSTASWRTATSPWALRRMVRSVGSAVAIGIWLVVVASAAWLLAGARASFALGGISWQGRLAAPIVAGVLAAPCACGYIVRGRCGATRGGFVRGSLGLIVATLALVGLLGCVTFEPEERMRGVWAAVFASCAAAWCPMVLDFATMVVPALVAEARRRLPSGERDADDAAALGGAPVVSVGGGPCTVNVGGGPEGSVKAQLLVGNVSASPAPCDDMSDTPDAEEGECDDGGE